MWWLCGGCDHFQKKKKRRRTRRRNPQGYELGFVRQAKVCSRVLCAMFGWVGWGWAKQASRVELRQEKKNPSQKNKTPNRTTTLSSSCSCCSCLCARQQCQCQCQGRMRIPMHANGSPFAGSLFSVWNARGMCAGKGDSCWWSCFDVLLGQRAERKGRKE